jgi:predicted neuraminidase
MGVPAATPLRLHAAFVFERAPFLAAHASTIAETTDGLVAAWFAGTREGHGDVGIWVARQEHGRWLHPVEVADGRVIMRRRYPCWNPVLFQPTQGPLLLFYKVGPSPSRWWGMLITSEDGGRSWSEPRRLPASILGPIKNKPIQLPDGRILCPSSDERGRWRIHLEWADKTARTWRRGPPLNDGRSFAAIQPCLLTHAGGRLQMLCRTRQGSVGECWSEDGGESWTPLAATELPNPDSGIDAVTLASGQALLAYNHARSGRTPLNLALSDDGRRWSALAVLEDEPGEFSYPAAIQARDGTVHVTYTWNRRRIRHVSLCPADFTPVAIKHSLWPDDDGESTRAGGRRSAPTTPCGPALGH